jgi:5-methylcytosine-specific restriction enzyme A
MKISFEALVLGEEYDRPYLADLWGYESWHAIGRGIVTPKNHDLIILFVTREKQKSLTQYQDHFIGEQLMMEGEKGHRTDERLVNSLDGPDRIFLFHRIRHHMPFTYYGEIFLDRYELKDEEPSIFYFNTARSLVSANSSIITESVTGAVFDESFTPSVEGRQRIQTHVRYERSRKNRAKAIEIHGTICMACGFDFNQFYGPDLARDFIEVHHVESITSTVRVIDPANDLIPLCANCHRMVHRKRGEILPIRTLIKIIEKAGSPEQSKAK